MKLSDFEGDFFETKRDGKFETIGNYASEPQIAYLSYAEDETYLRRVCEKTDISCVICTKELSDSQVLMNSEKGIAIAEKPRTTFNLLHNWMASNIEQYYNAYDKTIIGANCKIHESVIIPKKGVVIGDNCTIEEYVVIRPGTVIGNNVEICAGSKIGVPSHIIVKDLAGNNFLVKQIGNLNIGDDVSIGYNCTIARGSFPYEYTSIGEYTKIENGVEISHNSRIGKNCIITGQSQICGNAILGDGVRLSPKAIISNRLRIANKANIDIGSVVVNNLKEGDRVSGNFAINHDKFLAWHRKKLKNK